MCVEMQFNKWIPLPTFLLDIYVLKNGQVDQLVWAASSSESLTSKDAYKFLSSAALPVVH